MPTGKVKWYDADKGFGFLSQEEGEDVYVRSSALPAGVEEVAVVVADTVQLRADLLRVHRPLAGRSQTPGRSSHAWSSRHTKRSGSTTAIEIRTHTPTWRTSWTRYMPTSVRAALRL